MKTKKLIYHFDEKIIPTLSEVWWKALSLIKTTQLFPVPGWFVLTSSFFDWRTKDKQECTSEQQKLLQDAIKKIATLHTQWQESFAVRSSSTEEDLEGTSFAGMYETFLEVSPKDLEKNIIKAYLSCYDVRDFH